MARPIFQTAPQRQCADCGIIDTPYKHPKSGYPKWYRNRWNDGKGYLCMICYQRIYLKTYQRKDRKPRKEMK